MGEVSTVGLDIAKSVFQVHGVDVVGAVVISRAIGICDGCWSLVLWPSSAMRDSTARNGSGSSA
jgi:hypothetical protein